MLNISKARAHGNNNGKRDTLSNILHSTPITIISISVN